MSRHKDTEPIMNLMAIGREQDLLDRSRERRDQYIIAAAQAGFTATQMARSTGGKLTPERIRQICRDAGVELVGSRSRPRGRSGPEGQAGDPAAA